MNVKSVITLSIVMLFSYACTGSNPDLDTGESGAVARIEDGAIKTVKGGALYLAPMGIETHRAEFLIAEDCENVAKVMNEAEPLANWHCSTSVPDIVMTCEISGFALAPEAEAETGLRMPESLAFSLVLNRGSAWGYSDLGVPLTFKYTESGSSYLLTSDYLWASGNYFTSAVYLLIIDSASGMVEVRDIGGESNGEGECELGEG